MFMHVNFIGVAMDGWLFGIADIMATFQTAAKFRPPVKFRTRRFRIG
jgi:hypothetical protein